MGRAPPPVPKRSGPIDLDQVPWSEAAAARSARTVALLPIGAIEAHGPHLPLAYVALRDGVKATAELTRALIEHVRANLVHYKAPRRIEYLPVLPRNDRGKIARAELRRLADSARQARGARTARP